MSDPRYAETEMIETERITGQFFALELPPRKVRSEESFMQGLFNAQFSTLLGKEIPEHVTPQLLREVQARYRSLIGEWNSLPHRKIMEVEWSE